MGCVVSFPPKPPLAVEEIEATEEDEAPEVEVVREAELGVTTSEEERRVSKGGAIESAVGSQDPGKASSC